MAQTLDLDVAYVAVDVDYDGYCDGGLGGADAYGEEREEEALQMLREEETVEDHEIDIDRVEYQI